MPPVRRSAGTDGGSRRQPVDVALHPGQLGLAVQRPVVHVLMREPIPRRLRALGDLADEFRRRAPLDEHPGGGGAILPCVAERRFGDGSRRGLQIHIREDQDRRLPAEFKVNPFQVGAAHRRDVPPGARAAGDRDQIRARMLDQGRAGAAVSDNNIEHARRQVLGCKLRQHHRRHGRRLRRLQDDGIPRGEGGAYLPDRHEQRVIPGRNLAADAYGLAPDPGLISADVFAHGDPECAAGQRGEVPEMVQDQWKLERAQPLKWLARVPRLGLDKLLAARFQGFCHPEQRQASPGGRRAPPGAERIRRRLVGKIDIRRPGYRR